MDINETPLSILLKFKGQVNFAPCLQNYQNPSIVKNLLTPFVDWFQPA